jgi:hypothetical protein
MRGGMWLWIRIAATEETPIEHGMREEQSLIHKGHKEHKDTKERKMWERKMIDLSFIFFSPIFLSFS